MTWNNTMTKPKTPGRVVPADQKLKMGRPRKDPPPDAADVIRAATAAGASKIGTAMALGCNVEVLNRWIDEDPALAEAFSHGREQERQTLHGVLYERAIAGDGKDSLIAAMFLLKARHGYQEGQQESQANRVSINFTIPGAMPLTQFGVIENEPNNTAKPVSAKLTRST